MQVSQILLSQNLCTVEMDRMTDGLSCLGAPPEALRFMPFSSYSEGRDHLSPHPLQKKEATGASAAVY